MSWKSFLLKCNRGISFGLMLLFLTHIANAQTYFDGPIQLQVRLHEIYCSDNPLNLPSIVSYQSSMTYNVYVDDNMGMSGLNWPGASCLTDQIYLPGTSKDFNTMLFNYTYPTNVVPKYFDVKLYAFEDILPSLGNITGFLGLCQNYSRCVYDGTGCCFGVNLFGNCVGITESDRNLCDAKTNIDFKDNLDYRLNSPPCEWKDWGLVTGTGCGDYKPHLESYWRYTKGTDCNNSIALGTMCAGSSILHYNSNECYANNYPANGGNDVFYSFDICGPIGITASVATNPCATCGSFNNTLYLLDANCNVIYSSNGTAASQASISTYLCAPGPYHLVVDGATAADQGTFTLSLVEDPNLTFLATINKTNVTCTGLANGTAKVVKTGGVLPYGATVWSNGATTDSIFGLSPGTYGVTITDAHGCTVSASTTITQPTPLTVASITETPVTCSGYRDGTATVTPTGGTTPYHYFWSGAPPQITQTATNLPAGLIAVTVLDSQGCYTVDSVTVTASTTIINTLLSLNDVTCFGAQDGSISISIGGGTPAYTYAWSNGAATPSVSNLDTGTYHLSVTDQNSCSITSTYHINEPPQLTVQVNATANVRCNGGSDGAITIAALGGVQPYTYLWSNAAATQDLLNIPAGNYQVTVTDAHGCTIALANQVAITEPPALAFAFTETNPSCYGKADGSINSGVTGGTTPYTYLWTNNATTPDLTGLSSGVYGLLVTDANNCFKFGFKTLTDPPQITLQDAVSHVACNGASTGTINIIAAGGTGGYTYTWNPANVSGSTPTGIGAGFYSVTVTDQSGCTATMQNIIVNQPDPLVASVIGVDSVLCDHEQNGRIICNLTGGVQPYTYLWNNGNAFLDLNNVGAGIYWATFTDANNCTVTIPHTSVYEPLPITISMNNRTSPSCNGVHNGAIDINVTGGNVPYVYNWDNGATTQDLTNIDGGEYTILVTDYKGCAQLDTFILAPVSAVVLSANVTDLTCNGISNGQIALHVAGGTPAYSYSWSNGNQTDSIIKGIPSGNYTVTVTDQNGCKGMDSLTVGEPPAMTLAMAGTKVSCFGFKNGTASGTAGGGTPSFSYAWSDGQITDFATALDPGTYKLTVTDRNNCSITDSITIVGPAAFVATVDSVTGNQCYGDNGGLVSISAVGGTMPYQFSVLNNVSQSTGNFTNLLAGNYTAVVIDSNNCRATSNFTIAQPNDWSVKFKDPYIFVTRGTFTPLAPLLVDTAVGSVNTFSWDPIEGLDCPLCRNPKASPAITTTYTVTVTDSNGCTHQAQVVVVAKDQYEVFYPNVFSPNGDGNNDTWAPLDFGSTQSISIQIFDRWGELVYQTNDITKGWDGTFSGKILPSDVYAYVVSGTLKNNKDFKKTGSLSLIR